MKYLRQKGYKAGHFQKSTKVIALKIVSKVQTSIDECTLQTTHYSRMKMIEMSYTSFYSLKQCTATILRIVIPSLLFPMP